MLASAFFLHDNKVPDGVAPDSAEAAPAGDARPGGAQDDAQLERDAIAAAEAAGIQGLCRNGQEEIAADLVRGARPNWPDGAVAVFVRHVMRHL